MSQKSDIAIVGGGLVGLSAALALQKPNLTITVLESSSLQQRDSSGLNARSIALSHASIQIFKALGLSQEIKKQASPIKTIHISSRGGWGVTRLKASDYDLDAMGYVIESQKLSAILLDQVQRSKSISLATNAEFASLEFVDQLQLQYKQDKKLQNLNASLVLIADGAQSKARSCLGIEHRMIDYQQAAIIANVEVSQPLEGAAYERFTERGPLAMLPLGGSRYACVWTHDPRSSENLMQLDGTDFCESLQRSFGFRLGFIKRVGRRYCFPLHRTEALELAKNRCLLVGNAANTLHPVAGQGLNLALRDVASLNHLLESQAISSFETDSVIQQLQEYQNQRKQEQARVVRLGDGLVGLFSNDIPMLKHFRAGALALLDIVPPLKAEVTMSGMGFGFGGNPMLRGRMR